ncbi:Protein angel homolog 2 [Eumeta japonica]|uniref:Protein angel homolog 2 n=1 Tax=Eumeta variegata TaxID=151549 RepID=A0A4C1W664_EUMVA|nr:Protein angel homolog 2 [Eumeta japonica]
METTWMDTEGEWRKALDDVRSEANIKWQRSPVPPNFRIWEEVTKRKSNVNKNCCKFKLMSYNVLAQYLLEYHPHLYTECDPQNLTWDRRSKLLYEEIVNLSPDILCLQEVEVTHLHSFFSKFNEIGYQGVYKQKTGDKFDGCAIYFRRSMFNLIDYVSVEFLQPDLPLLNRDNIGIIAKLVPRSSPGAPFVVATTHLLYNPRRTDVRLAQIQVFLAELDRFSYDNSIKEPGYLPIILTGDLNSTPDNAVVQLLDHGHVDASPFRDNSDWRKIGVTDRCQHLAVQINRKIGEKTVDFSKIKLHNSLLAVQSMNHHEELIPQEYNNLFNSGTLKHSLKLSSVYDKVKSDGQCEATTFQDYWVTVDYIYFSQHSRLHLGERLRLPTANECEVLGCLPNSVYGSDHLALAAVFEYES